MKCRMRIHAPKGQTPCRRCCTRQASYIFVIRGESSTLFQAYNNSLGPINDATPWIFLCAPWISKLWTSDTMLLLRFCQLKRRVHSASRSLPRTLRSFVRFQRKTLNCWANIKDFPRKLLFVCLLIFFSLVCGNILNCLFARRSEVVVTWNRVTETIYTHLDKESVLRTDVNRWD